MSRTTEADRLRAYARDRRVFTRADIIRDLGEAAAGPLGQLTGGDITRHAKGVYSLAGIRSDDPRVVTVMEETSARPLTEADRQRDSARAEERSAAALASKIRTDDTLIDRVAAHFEDNPVASATTLKRLYGQGATSAAKTLVDREVLDRVRDGLWVRAGVEHFGPDMRAYVAGHSTELATVRREMEELDDLAGAIAAGGAQVEWSVSRPPGRGAAVYLNLAGAPPVFARSNKGRLVWYALKGRVSPTAAEHIARMVVPRMPERLADLIDMVESGDAPTSIRRRHGTIREYERSVEEPIQTRGYGPYDTEALDPRRLGHGLPEEVVLEIDDREDDRIVTMLAGVPNLHIIRTHLEMADFVGRYGDRTIAIERKTSADLSASLDDNRLAEQVHRMSDSGMPCCFVIEGGVMGTRSQPIARLAALQTRLSFGVDMRIIETLDVAHTAYVVVTMLRDHFFGTGSAFDLRPVKLPGLGNLERAQHMIQAIPGISPTRSAALLDRFGSIAAIANAGVKEIMTVEGVGKKTAEQLHAVLNASARGMPDEMRD